MSESPSSNPTVPPELPTRAAEFEDGSGDDFHFAGEVTAEFPVPAMPDHLGDYAIKEMIGAGGMGQVYLAEHVRMQRIVAIKTLPGQLMKDPRAVSRFYDEIRAASRVLHPNIVAAFDAGEDKGIHYLAMEYVDGMTLTRWVSRSGPMSVGQAASVIRQAAMGLLHAHRVGIIHRDVKPGNLMRSIDGTVKVVDLGLARLSTAGLIIKHDTDERAVEEKPNKGRLIGTLPFMAPEQLEDPDSADPRSDIYSLGATLYFLLTAQPPFAGDYLEQVYGHRHGEIPDLMQMRRDVDLQFANIFRRMMAKTPEERYASLDEVIEDLGEYADKTSEPQWLAEFSMRQPVGETGSTLAGGSTAGQVANVMAIDLGMFFSAAAEASPAGRVNLLTAGGGGRSLFRMAVSSDGNELFYGDEAMKIRTTNARNLAHCAAMYIGKPVIEREIAGRQCPPEVLLGMMIRKLTQNAWEIDAAPAAVALTVPASYDQFHRRAVLQAAQIAGLSSVRLVDRSVAAVQSALLESAFDSLDSEQPSAADAAVSGGHSIVEASSDQFILFVGLTGQATETAVFQRDANRLKQLATAGHWNTGTLPWQQRLVELAADIYLQAFNVDPRKTSQAPMLQVACESAMNALMILPSAKITVEIHGTKQPITIRRSQWLTRCKGLLEGLRRSIKVACMTAGMSRRRIDTLVTLGPLLRIKEIRDEVLRGLRQNLSVQAVDRSDVARGAAACLAGELPGRSTIATPPLGVTSQTIGILVEDGRGRRRILPILPKSTPLPARANRRLTVGEGREKMALSLVESSGIEQDDWQSLGRYDFTIDDEAHGSESRARSIGFEINVNGLLTVRAQTPGMPGSTKLATLPKPNLSDEAVAAWTRWVDKLD
ncbi:protein kinase domain-containing protein [Novipirellula artificiosorum]|uniref:Serine/threonine-protein kinase PknB n=1 Tax=Novipirellula artificiosorum TaxID=2528016 RepID=A0A5C6DF62_9BACT|nr:Hsp70 family protein [Novipirellula artificiosorum]TWU33766.1 Serine/threonine-protein kinase PknB [Novipirellula artificiosorum]